MTLRNPNLSKLQAGYLFPEINRRKNQFLQENPGVKLISLGIGNTTEPLTPFISNALSQAASKMGNRDFYSGYGEEQGFSSLREKIAKNLYHSMVETDEIFVSDGSKCDIGRLQLLFGPSVKVAVQDPSYPVYVDGSVLIGSTGNYNSANNNFDDIIYLDCKPENNFFPDLEKAKDADLIYFCSPNNPTGAVATKEQLKELVDFAKANKSIIIFDSAYSEFISDENLPKSIYEIEGAKEVAIEVGSFSKSVGFTGVRLGWSIVPEALKYEDGFPVNKDWNRIVTTVFNGASNIIQYGGLAALEPEGMKEMRELVSHYMENAKLIKAVLDKKGIENYGGSNAPYIWAAFPGKNSWDVFEDILKNAHIITTPGSGFGDAGEGFVRFSAFGHRKDIEEAVKRLEEKL